MPRPPVDRLLPGLAQLRGYRRSWLRGDLVAGVTVGAYLVPEVMAYGPLAGLPPVAGLGAILAPVALYALLGSSRQLSVGPESTTALMTATVVAPLAGGDPARYAVLAAAVAVVVGLLCLLAFAVRLGFVADLLSRPILVGYLAGVALTMIVSQLGKLTGVPMGGDTFVGHLVSFVRHLPQVDPGTLLFAGAVLAFLLVGQWRFPALPVPLLAVLLRAGGPLLARFPPAALGAIVVYAALRLIDLAGFRRLNTFRRNELLLAVAALAGVLVFDILYGVLLAVGLSVVEMLHRIARPHDAVQGLVPNLAGMPGVDDYPQASTIPGLVGYRYC